MKFEFQLKNVATAVARFAKKVAMTAIALCFFISASAQKGEMAIGGNLLYGGGNHYDHFGIGVKFFGNITDHIRLAGESDLFPKQDYLTCWEHSAYGHYLFPVSQKVALYPSVGLGVMGWHAKIPGFGKTSNIKFALSLGGGVDFDLTSRLLLSGEFRWKIIPGHDSGNRINLAIGLAYKVDNKIK